MLAATTSAKSAAPGLRTTKPATIAATNHTPYKRFCAGGTAANAGVVADHTSPHAQKTTPNATAIAAVTTMSTVRQAPDGITLCLLRVLR